MRPTYAELMLVTAERRPEHAAESTPLLGLLSGFVLAAVLWTSIGGLVWLLVN